MPGSAGRSFHFTSIIIVSLLALSMIPVPGPGGAAPITDVNWFGDASVQEDVQFNGPGTDTTTATLSFQKGVTVQNASFKVVGQEYLGESPSNITIDVGGDGTPEWRFGGLGYGSLGHQEFFVLDDAEQNRSANLTISRAVGENKTAVIRLPYGAQVNSAVMELEVKGVSVAVECKSGSASCNVVDNDPAYSLRDIFENEGWSVDIVTGTDIDTVAELNQYTVVILGDSGHSDNDHTTFQTAMKDWVQNNGGGMVATGWMLFTTPSGSDLDDILPVSPPASWSSAGAQVTITNSNHPITNGVANFNTPSGNTYCESGPVDSGATTLGTCNGASIVYKEDGAGRTVYLGPIYFGSFESYNSEGWYTDANAIKLMAQATLWASGGGTLSGWMYPLM